MPNQPSSLIPIGTIIDGKYRIERHVGDGGMGQVVAARHLVLNELFAIKFMHQRDLANPQAAARFVREAQAVVKLRNSEHVARVHDVGKLDTGDLYIVMELLVGLDLGEVLKRRGVLPIQEACAYVLQACSALVEAHELGIIHRDLKPANLFLTHRKDGSACIKVLDFGISKILSTAGQEAEVEMTGTREMMGSPLYMSPEQAKSARDVDARTDIWALGAILYKLLTGKAPISGETVAEVSFALLESTSVRPPSNIRRDIPPNLEACILRCLEKSVHRRYGRVTDLMAALTPFAMPPQPEQDDDDSAATVLRPMSGPHSSAESFGGTLPLSPEQLGRNRSGTTNELPANRTREQSGTDVMPHFQVQGSAHVQRNAMNAALPQSQVTQPLDGHALRAAVQAQRMQDRKPSFTSRVNLPPANEPPQNSAMAAPQLPSVDSNTPQFASHVRMGSGVRVPTIMPPPIPPSYPTGAYPIAAAARATSSLPVVSPSPIGADVTEPPWGHTQRKSGATSNAARIVLVAVVTTVVGLVIALLWQSESISNPAELAASSASAMAPAASSAKRDASASVGAAPTNMVSARPSTSNGPTSTPTATTAKSVPK